MPEHVYRTETCGCGALFIWAITDRAKRMPVDVEPTNRGNVELIPRKGIASPRAHIVPAAQIMQAHRDGVVLRTSHFATCPDAAQHRTRKAARA